MQLLLAVSLALLPQALLSPSPASSASSVRSSDGGKRFWNQPQGEPSGGSFVDVAPIEQQPEERWRVALGTLASEPVVWDAAIFVVTEERGSYTLVALDSGDGSKLANERLGRLAEAGYRLAVWHDMVVVITAKSCAASS